MSISQAFGTQTTSAAERVLPHDMLAEQSVLGAMLLSIDACPEIVTEVGLKGADFYAPKHEIIFDAILKLYTGSEPTDTITTTAELTRQGNLVRVGGADYLHTLTSIVPTAANAAFYGKIVQEKAILRRLVEAGTKIAASGYAAEGDVIDLINAAQSDIFAVGTTSLRDQYSPLNDAIGMAVKEIEFAEGNDGEIVGVPTGIFEVDMMTHGLHPGQLVILAARPGVGKSTFALDIARNAAIRHKLPSLFFSLEMSKAEIAMRLLSAESDIYLKSMRQGKMSHDDWTKMANVRGSISDAPLYIDDSPNLTLAEIRSKARRLTNELGLKLIVIDYLQLLSSGKKVESRQQEVSEFSRSLKLLAKELEIPVIAIAQLNRGSEEKKDKKPELHHLRESGSLEQDADLVLLLHREDIGQKEHPRAGEADIIIAKQRNGPTGTVISLFQGQYSKFVNLQK
ncbi:MAG: replicative DNA helicase [Rhodoluna sp.]